jgi:hypothetical protein
MRWKSHVRFGRRAAETDRSRDRHRAAARPHTEHSTREGKVYCLSGSNSAAPTARRTVGGEDAQAGTGLLADGRRHQTSQTTTGPCSRSKAAVQVRRPSTSEEAGHDHPGSPLPVQQSVFLCPHGPDTRWGRPGRRTTRPARAARGQHPSPRTLAVSVVRWISEEATLFDLVSSANRFIGSTVSSTQKYPGRGTSLRSKNCPQRLQS